MITTKKVKNILGILIYILIFSWFLPIHPLGDLIFDTYDFTAKYILAFVISLPIHATFLYLYYQKFYK